jgi:predicted aspartyl protease
MARRVGGIGGAGSERRACPRSRPALAKEICRLARLSSTGRTIARLTLLAVLNFSQCEGSFAGDLTVRTPSPPRTVVEIPFKVYQDYLIVVDGRIGNLDHQNLLLDTGSNPSMIDQNVSAKLGLQGVSRDLALFNKSVASENVTLPDLQCGPLRRQNLSVMVADFSAISRGLGTRIDAVIGLDVLGATNFTVDYAKRRIIFGTASLEHHTVPFAAGQQFITVNVKSGGRQLHLLVDTGTPQLVLFENRLRGVDYVPTSVVGTGHNASGNVRFGAVVLPQAKIGTLEVGPQRASVVTSQQDFASDLDGLMGVSCLRPKRISFDFDRQLLGWSD